MAEQSGKDTTFIGRCNFRGNQRIFGVKKNDRRQHMYVIGKTGVGKTVLLKNLALQDIRAGKGICIIDPHGEFVEEVLGQIPSERAGDVVYFNPVDSDYPIGFNVLEVADQKYKHLVVSDLLGIFTKIWANVWSARMEYILQNCIMALLDTPGTTLLGIPRLLVDKDYRQKIVANVKDPVVKSFWVHEYETWRDQFRNEAIVPIQNKVNQFLNTSFIRNIVGQEKSSLNITEIMNSEKILLVNVSKGKIGEDNSGLLGAMIITKIQLAAMERVRILEEERKDFYLYVDEFQNFATDSFANILSESRKYRLNLILAHQYVGQLVTDNSTKVRDAVFGNVGTMISFRVGAADAEALENEFTPEFMMNDLIGLPNHHIYIKLMVDGVTSRPFSAVTMPPLKFETDPDINEKIIARSRAHYASARTQVEQKIAQWSGIITGDGASAEGGLAPGQLVETPCWNCGKTATVPFKPDGKRPVYCMSCLKQIEEGKLIPIPDRMPQLSARARYSQSLEGLGIEFQAESSALPTRGAPGAPPRPRTERDRGGEQGSDRRMQRSSPPRPIRPQFQERPQNFDRGGERRSPERFPERPQDFDRGERRQQPPQQPRSSKPLNNEFSRPRREERGVPPLRGASKPVVKVPQSAKPMSLSNLKGSPEEEKQNTHPVAPQKRSAPNASELREVLQDALKNFVPPKPVEKAKSVLPPPIPAETSETLEQMEQVINPGDSVKF